MGRGVEPRRRLLVAAAERYRSLGWVPTPVRGKRAYLPGWPSRHLSSRELRRELQRPGCGMGLVLGEASGWLVDVDLDRDEAADLAPQLLPSTPLIHGRPGRPTSHWWYVSPGTETSAFRTTTTGMIAELRAGGTQTCVPPSAHPSGEALRWESWGAPARLVAAALRRAVGRLAVATFLVIDGFSARRALDMARTPDREALAALQRRTGYPPLTSWLGLSPVESTPRSATPATGRTASGFTQAILARIDVPGAARLLGLDLTPGRQACPFHDDRHPSLQCSGYVWICHAGCGAGNAIHLVAVACGIGYLEARSWLAARLHVDWRDHWSPPPPPDQSTNAP